MPATYPNSPKLIKGAFVEYKSKFLGPIPNIILFQYNPKQLTRNMKLPGFEKETKELESGKKEVLKVPYPPTENISLNIVIDATDQLEKGNPIAVAKGILPTLSALELMIYPETYQVFGGLVPSSLGSVKLQENESVAPYEVPLVLFIWGISRVLPVKITELTITETAFDSMLNPIRANVKVGMKVLTWKDLEEGEFAHGAYMWTQTQKEVMARLNLITSAEIAIGQFF